MWKYIERWFGNCCYGLRGWSSLVGVNYRVFWEWDWIVRCRVDRMWLFYWFVEKIMFISFLLFILLRNCWLDYELYLFWSFLFMFVVIRWVSLVFLKCVGDYFEFFFEVLLWGINVGVRLCFKVVRGNNGYCLLLEVGEDKSVMRV